MSEPGMIERIARMLYWMDGRRQLENGGVTWSMLDKLVREKYIKEALAVLEEMREATAEMVDAGRDVGPAVPYGLHEVRERWTVMIDVAIAERHALIAATS